MMRRIATVLAGVVTLLGVVHISLAIMAPGGWRPDHLWFIGAGLAILLTGLINIVMLRAASIDRMQHTIWILMNVLTTGFFVVAWASVKGPQVIVGGAACLLLAVCALAIRQDQVRSAY